MNTRYRILIVTRGSNARARIFTQVWEEGTPFGSQFATSKVIHSFARSATRLDGVADVDRTVRECEESARAFITGYGKTLAEDAVYVVTDTELRKTFDPSSAISAMVLGQLRAYAGGDGPTYVQALEDTVRKIAYTLDPVGAELLLDGTYEDFPDQEYDPFGIGDEVANCDACGTALGNGAYPGDLCRSCKSESDERLGSHRSAQLDEAQV